MKRAIAILIFLTTALCNLYAIGNFVEVDVRHLTAMDGLASNSVRHIYQDSKGFIWFGTLNSGLCRYDGNTFTTIYPEHKEKITLVDPRIKSIQEDDNGFLWISTMSDEICCYDLKTNKFIDYIGEGNYHYKYNNAIFIDGDIWLWGKTHGCRKVSYRDGVFSSVAFCVENNELPSDYVSFITKGASGSIWIGMTNGLCRYSQGEAIWVDDECSFLWACRLRGKDYFITSNGKIWLADGSKLSEVGLIPGVTTAAHISGELVLQNEWLIFTTKAAFVFDPTVCNLQLAPKKLNIPNGQVAVNNKGNYLIYNKTERVHYIDAATSSVKSIEVVPKDKIEYWSERYGFIQDSRGIVWISTHGNGLFAYDLKTDNIQHFSADYRSSSGIASNILLSVVEDRTGSLWVGSEYAGVFHLRVINDGASYIYMEQGTQEYSNMIRMITPMGDDIWLSTRDGKIHVYDASMEVRKRVIDFDANIYVVRKDTDGVVWLGSRGKGLYIGNKNYRKRPNDITALSDDNIFCIEQDNKGRMWIGTFGGGLNLTVKEPSGGYSFRSFFNDTYNRKRIRSLLCDSNGWIWTGTSEGIIVFNPDKMPSDPTAYHAYNCKNKALNSDEIRSIMQDSRGRVWIAESGVGFCVSTPGEYDKLEFKHYTIEDGLINGMVQTFVEDALGQIWITTEYGISCFDADTEKFINFIFSSNMQSNVCCDNCAIRMPDGRILVGTNSGVAVIDQAKVVSIRPDAVVTFTDMQVNGIPVLPAPKDSPISRSMAYESEVELKYNQNSFVISFSTMDYSYFTGAKYSYILDNYDDDWSIPSELNFAAYKNLPAGSYKLRVKASNSMGIWSNHHSEIKIVIKPPFWQTSTAYLFFILFIMAILYVVYRTLRNMNILRNNIKIEKQLTEYKLVFFTNISHEFRTPLTLILSALERMQRTMNLSPEMNDAVRIMGKGSQRMMRLVNQLLEFRKMQNNKLALSLERTDVIAYLYEIYLAFKDAAASQRIELNFLPNIASYKMYIDKGNVDKVVYNLLSNALKYTPAEGRVDFAVSVNEDSHLLSIRVADTGIGIPKEKHGQLFSRFMHSSFSNSSIGVGLHLTHELVVVHKGTIRYEQGQGGGSIFVVTLSLDASIYDEGDFLIPSALLNKQIPLHESTAQDLQVDEIVPMQPLNGHRILIIEDDSDIRELICVELRKYFDVIAEADGITGLDRIHRDSEIDLIICDVMMPGMSGYAVTKQLKGDFATCHIPIILLTALNSPESHLDGIESGADAYITKPFSSKLVLARVLKLIEQRSRLREKFSNDLSVKSSVMCTTDKDREFMERLTKTLESQLDNPNFSAEDFASQMAMGRSTFYNKVRSVTGYAPKEYIRIIRLKHAAELILKAELTFAEIAYRVGIHDPSYFTKCFKEQFGLTPKAYQKQTKKEMPTEGS